MNEGDDADERIFAALWVGSPKSIQEYCGLYDDLIHATVTDRDAPAAVIVFEDRVMPIDELVEAFSTDSEFVDAALSGAGKHSITQASMGVVLFSSTGDPLRTRRPPKDGLVFLGMCPFPAEDAEQP